MVIKQLNNPRSPNIKEKIVELTMTVDQFHMLKDCVTLAYQSADENSRMFKIAELIHNDFENLKLKE